ncbi:MAG: DUF3307 domain-containing protein [Anaerolineales bacterium]|nr:DUF3307 domain-containing protein [Anaerolineales bacterium]
MTTFPILLLAHLIADFPLQTNRVYALKTQGNKGLLLHVAIHVLVAAVLLQRPLSHIPLLFAYGAIHFAVDWYKVNSPARKQTPGFLLDQAAHFFTILVLTAWQPALQSILPLWLVWVGVFLALIPALLTLLWVIASDLQGDRPDSPTLNWASHRLLPLSQKVGSVFVLSLLVATLLIAV